MLPDADVLSAVEFDQSGNFLATGDRGGRIVVLEFDGSKKPKIAQDKKSDNQKQSEQSPGSSSKRNKSQPAIHYKFHCEFQSHDPEFDYVKSLTIDERINKIKWLKPTNNAQYMLSTNDKVVKLWKIYEKELKMVTNLNVLQAGDEGRKINSLMVPSLESSESFVISEPRRFFSNVHEFAINSLSPNTDGESFLTADNLRINLWNLEIYDQSFNIIDMKPKDPIEPLVEVITCAEFHPTQCNTLLYSSNLGIVRLADMRDRAVCDGGGVNFGPSSIVCRNQEEKIMAEVTQTITDCKFSPSGRFMVSRDYLTVKLWDIKMNKMPVETIKIHEYLQDKLTDLYHNECIFDNFGVAINNRNSIVAGGYNNYFHIYDLNNRTDTFIEASKNPMGVLNLDGSAMHEGPASGAEELVSPVTSRKKRGGSKSGSRGGLGGLLSRKKPSRSLSGSPKTSNKTAGGGDTVALTKQQRKNAALTNINADTLDYDKKILQVAWHPHENAVAVAGLNNLFIYSQ